MPHKHSKRYYHADRKNTIRKQTPRARSDCSWPYTRLPTKIAAPHPTQHPQLINHRTFKRRAWEAIGGANVPHYRLSTPRPCDMHTEHASQHGDIKQYDRRARNRRLAASIPVLRKHAKSNCAEHERLHRVGKEQTAWREGNGCLLPAVSPCSTPRTWL